MWNVYISAEKTIVFSKAKEELQVAVDKIKPGKIVVKGVPRACFK